MIRMNDKVCLDNLNDIQKMYLCDLSYVDITEEGYKKILEEGLVINELKYYVKNSNLPFCGDARLGNKKFNFLTGVVLGNNHFPSNLDVVNALIQMGLGSLKITHVCDYPKPFSSGFQALTFEDSYGNLGISYRGSDLYISSDVIREWLESNVLEYFSNTSTQVKEALEYFVKHKRADGNNYIFGHSLGGNLVSHVYLYFYDQIKLAFSINGTPINQKLIDSPEKIKAFNNKKISFNVVCGDIVSQLKSCECYRDNINYIKNNASMKGTILSAHMIQASSIDDEGNFIKMTESEMLSNVSRISINFIKVSKFVREKLNNSNFKSVRCNERKNFTNFTNIDEVNNKINTRL